MEKFTVLNGLVAPLDRANVDTDAIIPKQFLKSIKRTGYGQNLFDAWRYLDIGQPGMDNAKRPLNPDFVLNQARYKGAADPARAQEFRLRQLARARALGAAAVRLQVRHRAVLRRHLLQQQLQERLPAGGAHRIARWTACSTTARCPGFRLVVDLERQTVSTTDGSKSFRFDVDPSRRHSLLNGLDEIGVTLRHADEIRAFEARRQAQFPWLFR